MSNSLGTVLCFVFPRWLNKNSSNKQEYICNYFYVNALLSLICLPSVLICRKTTSIKRSESVIDKKIADVSFIESIKLLLQNKSYIYLTLSFSLLDGFYCAYTPYIEAVLVKYNFRLNQENGLIWVVSIGIVSAIVCAVLIDHYYKNYKRFLLLMNAVALFTLIMLTIFLEFSFYGSIITLMLYGASVFPFYCISFEFVGELVHPVSESIAVCFMVGISQVVAFVSAYLFEIFFSTSKTCLLWHIYAVILNLFALLFLFFVEGK